MARLCRFCVYKSISSVSLETEGFDPVAGFPFVYFVFLLEFSLSALSTLVLRALQVMMYRIREGVRDVDYVILTRATAVVLNVVWSYSVLQETVRRAEIFGVSSFVSLASCDVFRVMDASLQRWIYCECLLCGWCLVAPVAHSLLCACL